MERHFNICCTYVIDHEKSHDALKKLLGSLDIVILPKIDNSL